METMSVSFKVNAAAIPPHRNSCVHDGGMIGRISYSPSLGEGRGRRTTGLVVEAKGKRPMMERWRSMPPPPPPLPKLEDDGNPKFVIFIRPAKVNLWYPLTLVTGGTTAKIMIAAKDNFLGKYIYKDALAKNLATVVYKDETEIQKTARKQIRTLESVKEFRYGYKFIENNDLRAALTRTDVILLPRKEELKTVLDKVKDKVQDFFGEAKESFGKISSFNLGTSEAGEQSSVGKSKKGPKPKG